MPTVSVWSVSWHQCFSCCLTLIHITVHKSGRFETFMTQLVCCTKESGQVSTLARRQERERNFIISLGRKRERERLRRNGEGGGRELPHCTKPWQRTDCFLPSKEVGGPGASFRHLQRCNPYHTNEPQTHTHTYTHSVFSSWQVNVKWQLLFDVFDVHFEILHHLITVTGAHIAYNCPFGTLKTCSSRFCMCQGDAPNYMPLSLSILLVLSLPDPWAKLYYPPPSVALSCYSKAWASPTEHST